METKVKKNLKAGDKVEVFEDPITRLRSEGIAMLIKKQPLSGFLEALEQEKGVECWRVRFINFGPGEPSVVRLIGGFDEE